jgi:hypothetical protein
MAKGKKPAKDAHPLDIPAFLLAKGRGPRDEAVCRAMADRQASRGQEEVRHDPRISEAVRKGIIAASVLNDSTSQRLYLESITIEDRSAIKVAAKAEREADKAAKRAVKEMFVTVPELARELSKGKAERVRKTHIRMALDAAKWPRRDGHYKFLPDEVEAVTKVVLSWKPKKERKWK